MFITKTSANKSLETGFKFILKHKLLADFPCTVKPVYNDRKFVAVVGWWSLFRGKCMLKESNWDYKKSSLGLTVNPFEKAGAYLISQL